MLFKGVFTKHTYNQNSHSTGVLQVQLIQVGFEFTKGKVFNGVLARHDRRAHNAAAWLKLTMSEPGLTQVGDSPGTPSTRQGDTDVGHQWGKWVGDSGCPSS